MNADSNFEFCIVGAGLVGASLAIALASSGKRILLLESGRLQLNQTIDEDARNTVLGFGSRELLETMGVWNALQADLAEIDTVHVSQKGTFGVTRLTKETEGLPALGYLSPNYKILTALYTQLQALDNVVVYENMSELEISDGERTTDVTFTCDGAKLNISSKLLIAADGTNSSVRDQLGIEFESTDYGQSAVVANVESSAFEKGQAFERFTEQGPVALLPLANGKYSMIWVAPAQQVQGLMDLSDSEFLARLQKHFGFRVGLFEASGQRQAYPLRLLRAKQVYTRRCLLIGNAAYTVHPVAGQGFNLALRDIDYLSALLGDKNDPGLEMLLDKYERERSEDVDRIIAFTDGLLKLFTTRSRLLRHARGAALMTLGQFPVLQRQVSRQGLGLFRNRPRAIEKWGHGNE